jgi:hypothetical protein
LVVSAQFTVVGFVAGLVTVVHVAPFHRARLPPPTAQQSPMPGHETSVNGPIPDGAVHAVPL